MAIVMPDTLTKYITPANEAKKTGSTIMGKDDFLKMLFTQLKYQDPQNPVDDREFAAQLAQFSSLEQMTNMSTALSDLKTVMEQQGKFSLLQAVGKKGLVQGDALVPDAAGNRSGIIALGQSAAAVNVAVTDANGNPVRYFPLGSQAAGQILFNWDGKLADGTQAPAGDYRFTVQALDEQGKDIATTQYFEGTITGMTLEDDPTAYIGDIPVPFSKILRVKGT